MNAKMTQPAAAACPAAHAAKTEEAEAHWVWAAMWVLFRAEGLKVRWTDDDVCTIQGNVGRAGGKVVLSSFGPNPDDFAESDRGVEVVRLPPNASPFRTAQLLVTALESLNIRAEAEGNGSKSATLTLMQRDEEGPSFSR